VLSASSLAAIEQEHDWEQEQKPTGKLFSAKNYRPPRPIGVKGGCSPQNNCRKPLTLLNELPAGGNKILYENFCHPSTGRLPRQKSDQLRRMNDKVNLGQAVGTVRNRSEIGLHERASRSLVLYA
jgi:hypothetical protein